MVRKYEGRRLGREKKEKICKDKEIPSQRLKPAIGWFELKWSAVVHVVFFLFLQLKFLCAALC